MLSSLGAITCGQKHEQDLSYMRSLRAVYAQVKIAQQFLFQKVHFKYFVFILVPAVFYTQIFSFFFISFNSGNDFPGSAVLSAWGKIPENDGIRRMTRIVYTHP